MELLGVSVKVGFKETNVEVSRIEVEKETPQFFKLRHNNNLMFCCLINIPKIQIGVVQVGGTRDYVHCFERKIWVVDDGKSEKALIAQVVEVVLKELEDRKKDLDRMFNQVFCL